MAQNTECFGLYRNSQLRRDVTPTSRIVGKVQIIVEEAIRDSSRLFIASRFNQD